MAQLDLFKQDGQKAGNIEVKDAVFAIEPHEDLMTDVVLMQNASRRQGTHKVKNRSEVSGGGRKPWRQKGTGRARQGSIRSPQWVGGGRVFGPTPRSYAYKLPRKMRRLALRSALSQKASEEALRVVDSLAFDNAKTKDFKAFLEAFEAPKKVLVVLEDGNDNAMRAARNLKEVTVVTEANVNVYDLIHNDLVIMTQDALKHVEEVLA